MTDTQQYLSTLSQIQDSLTQELSAKLGTHHESHLKPLVYYGITRDDTPTEIFLDGIANFRLQPPANSVLYVSWIGAAFNLTDGELNTHGNHYAGIGNFTVRRAGVNTALVGAATGTGFIFTVDDTNDRVVCTVTGTAGKDIVWRCMPTWVCAANTYIPAPGAGAYNGLQ